MSKNFLNTEIAECVSKNSRRTRTSKKKILEAENFSAEASRKKETKEENKIVDQPVSL